MVSSLRACAAAQVRFSAGSPGSPCREKKTRPCLWLGSIEPRCLPRWRSNRCAVEGRRDVPDTRPDFPSLAAPSPRWPEDHGARSWQSAPGDEERLNRAARGAWLDEGSEGLEVGDEIVELRGG